MSSALSGLANEVFLQLFQSDPADGKTDRVHCFGAVDRDDRDPVAGFVADSIVGQSTVLLA